MKIYNEIFLFILLKHTPKFKDKLKNFITFLSITQSVKANNLAAQKTFFAHYIKLAHALARA